MYAASCLQLTRNIQSKDRGNFGCGKVAPVKTSPDKETNTTGIIVPES